MTIDSLHPVCTASRSGHAVYTEPKVNLINLKVNEIDNLILETLSMEINDRRQIESDTYLNK